MISILIYIQIETGYTKVLLVEHSKAYQLHLQDLKFILNKS